MPSTPRSSSSNTSGEYDPFFRIWGTPPVQPPPMLLRQLERADDDDGRRLLLALSRKAGKKFSAVHPLHHQVEQYH